MTNPYESPATAAHEQSLASQWRSWLARFALGLALMVALNVGRLALTWRAYRTCGMEQIGFPWVFFERGGVSYHAVWYVEHLALDLVIAIVVAGGLAHFLRDGWTALLQRMQTWGLDHIDHDTTHAPPSELATADSTDYER